MSYELELFSCVTRGNNYSFLGTSQHNSSVCELCCLLYVSSKEESYLPVIFNGNFIIGNIILWAKWRRVVILECVCGRIALCSYLFYVYQAKISYTCLRCLMLIGNIITLNVWSLV